MAIGSQLGGAVRCGAVRCGAVRVRCGIEYGFFHFTHDMHFTRCAIKLKCQLFITIHQYHRIGFNLSLNPLHPFGLFRK